MKTIFNLFLSLFIVSNSLIAQETPIPSEIKIDENFVLYVNKDKKYEIQYPKIWQSRPVPENFDLVLVAPPKASEKQISASMNLLAEFIGSSFNLEQFYNENIPGIVNELKEAKIENSGKRVINGIPAKWVLYTHTMNNLTLRVLQYFIIANQYAYLITFSAIADEFSLYQDEFGKIASTFRVFVSPAKTKTQGSKVNSG